MAQTSKDATGTAYAANRSTRPRRPTDPLAAERGMITQWLLDDARHLKRSRDVIEQLCERLVAVGVPLMRVMINVRTIHPQILSTGYRWNRGEPAVALNRGHDLIADPMYLESPFKVIHDGAGGIRRRLLDPDVALDFPVLEQIKAEGATDYLVVPLVFSDGTVNAASFAADGPDGFTTDQLSLIYDVLPILSLILEVQSSHRTARSLLDTYIGHHAGERVLKGQIQRGSGETIHAVVAYSDLRGFTAMTAAKPRDEIIAILNDYFECVIGAVHAHGGQVLKLIGDGMLAIFPLGDTAFRPYVCRSALDAAVDAARAVAALNKTRKAAGKPPIRFGFALHMGDVMYGNIGSANRLDFTAIGAAVNCAARVEELSAQLGETIVVTEPVAQASGRALTPLGSHRLRGLVAPLPLFTVPHDEHDENGSSKETRSAE
ncbi:MAG: adenylate/guanylate cyclase domain-containing protein [Alphaproteobacteria bacterium]|nr:adenylate/guanylate cyclase domain-containing protein [Alphaproteobacteria bacterium]